MPELLDVDQQPNFDDLAGLSDYLRKLLDGTHKSLRAFYVDGTGGFAHRLKPHDNDDAPKVSRASSSTCLALLSATGRLDDEPWADDRDALIKEIVDKPWNSAKLGKDNAFTVSFLLEALHNLGGEQALPEGADAVVKAKLKKLVADIKRGGPDRSGGVALQEYEATAFLTFKAVSALRHWGRLGDVRVEVERWNWNHLSKESVLVASESADADVFELAYSALIATTVAELDEMTPQQRALLKFALKQFFGAQRHDGTWPRSRPLFVYRDLGHAYCYDYEVLTALLCASELRTAVVDELPRLSRAAHALDERKYPLSAAAGGEAEPPYGWSSGHHGTYAAAESWATAAALHFSFELARLVADRLRQKTFEYVGAGYDPPTDESGPDELPDEFLDSMIRPDPETMLKQAFSEKLIAPLNAVRDDLRRGKKLPKKTVDGRRVPRSAILFGPPGTSKSELAKLLGTALGWPVLMLDPSHLTRHGLDAVHSEANKLFGMLERCEEIVVLLDEFDELVRERDDGSEMESRFLTTAMLPKLTALYKARRIVYLVATNHIEQFDTAIRRPGRFELVIPVMPPTAEEKLRNWKAFKEAIEQIDEGERAGALDGLGDLIFLEAEDLADRLEDGEPFIEALGAIVENCTFRQEFKPSKDGDGETWKDRMAEEIKERTRGV